MAYYENEILKELNVGEKYTGRQLLIYLLNHSDAYLFSKSTKQFVEWDDKTYKVLEIIKGYLHHSDSIQVTYHIPSAETTAYIVE